MAEVLMKTIANCETGEVIEVPLTPEEIAEHQVMAQAEAIRKAEEDAAKAATEALKASARTKLVAGEPLTSEEAATIVL
jgi:L-lactate utilization protein LutC